MNVRPNSKIVELKLHAYIFARNVNIIEKLKFRKIQLHSNDTKKSSTWNCLQINFRNDI